MHKLQEIILKPATFRGNDYFAAVGTLLVLLYA